MGGRENCCPLTNAFIGWFCMCPDQGSNANPWCMYQDDALTNWAVWPGLNSFLKCIIEISLCSGCIFGLNLIFLDFGFKGSHLYACILSVYYKPLIIPVFAGWKNLRFFSSYYVGHASVVLTLSTDFVGANSTQTGILSLGCGWRRKLYSLQNSSIVI